MKKYKEPARVRKVSVTVELDNGEVLSAEELNPGYEVVELEPQFGMTQCFEHQVMSALNTLQLELAKALTNRFWWVERE